MSGIVDDNKKRPGAAVSTSDSMFRQAFWNGREFAYWNRRGRLLTKKALYGERLLERGAY